jgi:hypothetical protein
MANRKVSPNEETAKLVSLYVTRLEVWDNGHILSKDRQERNVLACSCKGINTTSTKVQPKLHNLLYCAAYNVLMNCINKLVTCALCALSA